MRSETSGVETALDPDRLVDRFERCLLTRKEWNHRAHLTVAAWYLLHHPESDAVNKMRAGILRFNRARDIRRSPTGGYHETLTLFWLVVARRFLTRLPAHITPLDKIERFVKAHAERKKLYRDYYSHERIWSARAREAWVEPDRRDLPASAGGTP